MISYVGQIDQIKCGREIYAVSPFVAVGIVDDGLVTAVSRTALLNGEFIRPTPRGVWLRCDAVGYRRCRDGQCSWEHDLMHTEVQLGPNGPVFRHVSAPATICPNPPGNYICGG